MKNLTEKECKHIYCDTTFISGRSDKEYCSRNCKEKSSRYRSYNNDEIYQEVIQLKSLIHYYLPLKRFNDRIISYIGCTYDEYIEHLNDNPYGFKYGDKDMDIDHIIPMDSVTEDNIRDIFNYKNTQLIPSYYNSAIKNKNEWDKEHFEEWLRNN